MVGYNPQEMRKFVGSLLRWLTLSLVFAGAHAFAQTGGTVTYVYTDPEGTPLAEADASGNITATFEYTPYGTYAPQGTALPGPDPKGPGYAGHVNDPETNLVYMQARYYDSTTGQFLGVDPKPIGAGEIFSINRYGYANYNPILNIDANGKEPGPFFHPLTTFLQQTRILDWYTSAQNLANNASQNILSHTSVDAVGTAAWGGGGYYSHPIYNSDGPRAGIVLVGQGLEAKADVTYKVFTIDLPGSANNSSPLRFDADFSIHAILGGHAQIEFDPSGHLSAFLGFGPGMGESFSLLSGGMMLNEDKEKVGKTGGVSQGSTSGMNVNRDFTKPWDPGRCLCNERHPNSSMND